VGKTKGPGSVRESCDWRRSSVGIGKCQIKTGESYDPARSPHSVYRASRSSCVNGWGRGGCPFSTQDLYEGEREKSRGSRAITRTSTCPKGDVVHLVKKDLDHVPVRMTPWTEARRRNQLLMISCCNRMEKRPASLVSRDQKKKTRRGKRIYEKGLRGDISPRGKNIKISRGLHGGPGEGVCIPGKGEQITLSLPGGGHGREGKVYVRE